MPTLIIGVEEEVVDMLGATFYEQGEKAVAADATSSGSKRVLDLFPIAAVTTLSEFEKEIIEIVPDMVVMCGQIEDLSMIHFVESVRKNGEWGKSVLIVVLYIEGSLSDHDLDVIKMAIGITRGGTIGLHKDVEKTAEMILELREICSEMSSQR